MIELERMSYAELDALTEKLRDERDRRKELAKKTFAKRYETLNKIEQAFDDYYEEFHEYPFIRYGTNTTVQTNASTCNCNDTITYGIPYLLLYRK